MKRLQAIYGKHSVDIYFQYDATKQLSTLIDTSNRYVIITDNNVWQIYSESFIQQIPNILDIIVIPVGELSKSMDYYQQIIQQLQRIHFHRNDYLIALGGGVVGDLTGFIASTYLRGVPYIQIPSSLS